MLRGAIGGLLRACPPALAAKVRDLLQRDGDDRAPGKPACDWTDRAARERVYRDSAYGTGAHLVWLRQHGLTPMVTTQIPTAPGDRYPMNQFRIDLQAGR